MPIPTPKMLKPLAAIFCGDRDWTDSQAILDIANKLYDPHDHDISLDVLIDGHARGADRRAHDAAERLGIKSACFPADWDKHHRAAGPIRNKAMLDYLLTFSDTHRLLVVAFHDDLSSSKGTFNMVKQARKANVPCKNIRHKQS